MTKEPLISEDAKRYSLKPCIKCGSLNIEADSTGATEVYGVCYQSGWVLCKDCNQEICVDFDDSGHNIIEWADMIDIWNAGVDYDGTIVCEL